jgi:hypothetical protein
MARLDPSLQYEAKPKLSFDQSLELTNISPECENNLAAGTSLSGNTNILATHFFQREHGGMSS